MIDKDDVGAIASRIDAQTVVLIELLAEIADLSCDVSCSFQKDFVVDKYKRRYDQLAEKYREDIIS